MKQYDLCLRKEYRGNDRIGQHGDYQRHVRPDTLEHQHVPRKRHDRQCHSVIPV